MKKILHLLVFAFISQITTAQNALNFAGGVGGDTQSIKFSDDSDKTNLLDGATSYTIEAWVKPNGSIVQYKSFFSLRNSFRVTMASSNRFYFSRDNGSGAYTHFYSTASALTANVWQHIAVICDASADTLKLYVNGVDVTDGSNTAISLVGAAADNDFFVGYRYGGSHYVNAKIREVRVKNVTSTIGSLNTTTLSTNYATDGNTAFLFHFAEGTGLTTVNTASGTNATFGFDGSHKPTWIPDTDTWTGTTDTDWNTGTNWNTGLIPTSITDVTVPDVANQPTTNANISVKTLLLSSGADATFTGTVTNSDDITIESGASLIASNSVSGNITYKRNLGTTNWYLISSPVIGETIVDFVTNNSTGLGSGAGVAQNKALAPYDNTQALSADRWSYYTVGQTDGADGDDTVDTFLSGQGFTTKLTASADIFFTGTMNVADVPRAITIGAGDAFNLIGNPYPSFMNSGTGGFLPDNTARLTSQTLWVWDQGTNAYIAKVTVDEFKIAPGQGFFVECDSAGDVTFEEADQSHQATDTFLRSTNSRPEVHLFMTDGTTSKFAKIYYINGTTTGFDNGYDGELFGGVSNPFAVYTHLVSDSLGKDYQIQSLPDSNYENMVIPVGVNATSGTEITFRANVLNMPAGMDVYLENRTANTFTKLTDNGTYTLTLNTDSNGIGQFYLRTSSSALGVENVLLDNVSIYKTSNSMLRVAGLQQGNASLKVVNLLGKPVFSKSFTTNGVSDISLSKLATGIYIVQLQTENGKLNKKIIIE